MDPKQCTAIITTAAGETILRANLLTGQRLTPTGKISHAKTRVYAQRYRKEWEEMPDFKGWLTAVPYQPTRAFCIYCNKNLHAHRLSLLKHTCTMKHQRCALQYQSEMKERGDCNPRIVHEVDDTDEIQEITREEEEEDDEDVEYVVERLEMDEEELEAESRRQQEEHEEEEEYDEPNVMDEHEKQEDSNDVKPILKKVKIEEGDESRDTLAQAMAHVHEDYMDESEDPMPLEMIIESENSAEDEHESGGERKGENDSSKENKINLNHSDSKPKIMDDNEIQSEVVVARPLQMLPSVYNLNPTSCSVTGNQPNDTVMITSAPNKTITIAGNKTVTLSGGSFTSGAKYVLGKSKFPFILPKPASNYVIQQDGDKTLVFETSDNRNEQAFTETAGTSHQVSKKQIVKNPFKSSTKKPRISTHVIDTSKGLPVGGLQVSLYKLMDGRWTFLNESNTNPQGRCIDLVENSKCAFTAGRYKMHFDVDKYFTLRRIETIYPFIEIVFDVKNPVGHYHIPVLLSPFGYTTYRGSDR